MIFVSHKHVNQEIAEALVDFIVAGLGIARNQIRCTSTPGSQLSFGRPIEEQLKGDISEARAVFALLTEESKNAHWVLFELGAAWALNKVIVPILAPGLSVADLPGPLPNYPCVVIGTENATGQMIDALNQVSKEFNIVSSFDGNAHRKLDLFVSRFAPSKADSSIKAPSVRQAMLFLLSNDIYLHVLTVEGKEVKFTNQRRALAETRTTLRELGIELTGPVSISSSGDAEPILQEAYGIISRKYPQDIDFFAAGWDFPMALADKQFALAIGALQKIDYPEIPDDINNPRALFVQVREYFEGILKAQS